MDWLNVVTDFDAKGNGTDDDTQKIQDALDAAVSGSIRATVYFPRGKYRVTAPLKLYHGTGVILRGEGNSLGTTNQIGSGYNGREVASVIFWDGIDATSEVKNYTQITRSGSIATVTTSAAHGMTVGTQYRVSIRGASEPEYNGSFMATPSPTIPTVFTYTVTGSPQDNLSGGTYVSELNWSVVLVVDGSYACPIFDLVFAGRNKPAQGISSIARSGSTATVTTPVAHNLAVNDRITIRGAVQPEYNISAVVIAAPAATVFAYTLSGTPSTPATARPSGLSLVPGNRARACINQISSVPDGGFAAGHALIRNVTCRDAVYGLQLDDEEVGTNCADNTIIHCSFADCDAGIRSESVQVVNNAIVNCDFNGCTIGIDHHRGGDLRVEGSAMSGYTGDLFLKAPGGGNNASSFVIDGIRLESYLGRPALLDAGSGAVNTGETDILIDGYSWIGEFYPLAWSSSTPYSIGQTVRVGDVIYRSKTNSNQNNQPPNATHWTLLGDWTTPLLKIGFASNCTFRGSNVKGPLADVTGGAGKATLRLEHCRFSYPPADLIDVGPNGFWKSLDSTDGAGDPISDSANWLDGDSVAQGTAGAALPFTITGGTGGTGIAGGVTGDVTGGAGGAVLITAGTGGEGVLEAGQGVDGGPGGSVRLQAGIGGAPSQGGNQGANGEVVVNDAGNPQNFRVESDSDSNCLLVDGVNNAVKLGGQTSTRVYQNAPSTAPTDSNLGNSQISFWIDQHATKPQLNVRVKYSNGTLKTGVLDLL